MRVCRDFHRGEETYGFSPSNLISLEADFAQLYKQISAKPKS